MFENLAKIFGLGASLAFLLALVHESIFMFILGIDVRIVPYQNGDVITLATLMLPSILGIQVFIILFEILLVKHLSKRLFWLGIFLAIVLSSIGYYGQVLLILLSLLLISSLFLWPVSIPESLSHISRNAPSILAGTTAVVIIHAFADAARARTSDDFPKAFGELDSKPVFLIRALGEGFVVRDSSMGFYFVQFDEIKKVSMNRGGTL